MQRIPIYIYVHCANTDKTVISPSKIFERSEVYSDPMILDIDSLSINCGWGSVYVHIGTYR